MTTTAIVETNQNTIVKIYNTGTSSTSVLLFTFHILNDLNFLHISKLQEMEEEAKVAPMSYRTQMLSQLRNYRRDIDQLSRALASNFLHSEFLKYM